MSSNLLPDDYWLRFASWTRLLDEDRQEAANDYYFDKILPAILPVMRDRSGELPSYEGLVSLLGFTPETPVLVYQLLKPSDFVVLHTPETAKFLETVRDRSGVPMTAFHHEPFLHDDEHTDDIFAALSKAIARFPSKARIAIEMTGGKKTMGVQLATAVAALKHVAKRSVDIVYIDYDEYLPRYRKPAPESSRLLVLPQLAESAASFFRDAGTKSPTVREMMVNPVFTGRGFSVEVDTVFVLMPFALAWSERVWKQIQQTCRSIGLHAKRADDLFGSEIMEDVWEGICQARVVIADLTGRNPNVYYELGLAHVLGKRVILLTQDVEDIPADLKRFRFVTYQDNVDGFEQLEKGLRKSLHYRTN